MDRELFSALDASINRALEGLRVCEDIVRFSLRNQELAAMIKTLRHQIGEQARFLPRELLLSSRDIEGDGQKFNDLESEKNRGSMIDVLRSNFRRAIEALRTLEELSKLVEDFQGSFQRMRFFAYNLEKDVLTTFDRSRYTTRLYRALYAIVDSSFVDASDYSQVCTSCIKGGASVIQLRMKGHSDSEVLTVAKKLATLCYEKGVLFIVNDRSDIACCVGAQGVHLGQDDMPVSEARKVMRNDMIIGISAHSYEEVEEALSSSPDYIAVGPLFDTKSKDGSMLRGIGTGIIDDVKNITAVPLVGIGGITASNAGEVIARGCHACAVIGDLYKNSNVEENARKIHSAICQ